MPAGAGPAWSLGLWRVSQSISPSVNRSRHGGGQAGRVMSLEDGFAWWSRSRTHWVEESSDVRIGPSAHRLRGCTRPSHPGVNHAHASLDLSDD